MAFIMFSVLEFEIKASLGEPTVFSFVEAVQPGCPVRDVLLHFIGFDQ
jgi:hypothetical protein